MRLLWNTDLATGVRQIDLQHQELIDLINELETAHEAGHDDVALVDVLRRLTSYAMFHFATEESLMSKTTENTPYVQHHLDEHRLFVDQLATLKKNISGVDSMQTVETLLAYLKSWLREHIVKTDKGLAKLLLSRPQA